MKEIMNQNLYTKLMLKKEKEKEILELLDTDDTVKTTKAHTVFPDVEKIMYTLETFVDKQRFFVPFCLFVEKKEDVLDCHFSVDILDVQGTDEIEKEQKELLIQTIHNDFTAISRKLSYL